MDHETTYRQLARRLDTIPNGYPATDSGVEIRLLARLFTPEQAKLAAVMRLSPETAAAIGERAGIEPREARLTLKSMTRDGLIGVQRGERKMVFHLIPFVVGIYENQIERIDEELANLVERYWVESRGGSAVIGQPAIHRVIPVEEAIPFRLEVFPYERASDILEGARSWGVLNCICRTQKRLIGEGCDHQVENCLVFAPVAGAFEHSESPRAITKDEALHILRESADAGLVHSTGNYREGRTYICNCCTCCCGILRGVVEFGVPTAIAHSEFRAVVDEDLCTACGQCAERCPFNAIAVDDEIAAIDVIRCVGCGQCTLVCPTGAISLANRPDVDRIPLPTDRADWMKQLAETRGISLADIQ